MSGVVLRCPTCGTTQNHPGECDACGEVGVRHFCANHNPGLWLDEPVCTACGARFGEPPPGRPERTPGAATAPPAGEMRRPESRSPKPRGAERPTVVRRVPPRPRPEPEDTPAT